MKGLWTVIALILAIPLFAQMDFTQKETIPIENGTFSYAELRSVEGTDRIVAYSQDTDNIYLTISDTDGNVVESMSLAMTDSTDARKMSYFEHEGEPRLIVSWIELGVDDFSGNNGVLWCRTDTLKVDIYSLDNANRISSSIVSSYTSDDFGSGTETYYLEALQPATYSENGFVSAFTPFKHGCSLSDDDGPGYYTSGYNSTILGSFTIRTNDVEYSVNNNDGKNLIIGAIDGTPIISTGRNYSTSYHDGLADGYTFIGRYIYIGDVLISDTYTTDVHNYNSTNRYILLSDKYMEQPETFTMLSQEYTNQREVISIFSERDLNGNEIWSTSETSFTNEHLTDWNYPSSCFTDDDDNPLTIYFAPDTTSYEIRNRLNGNIEDSGEAPFVPLNIERTEGGTLVYLASTDNGVQVWHGAYTVGIDDPTDTPRFDLTASNYPNPFNPTTTICYSIPSSGHVELDVYNTRGQRVKTLVNDVIDAGEHEAVWHGDNDMGETVSSGVYLYRLKSADKKLYGRMLMLK